MAEERLDQLQLTACGAVKLRAGPTTIMGRDAAELSGGEITPAKSASRLEPRCVTAISWKAMPYAFLGIDLGT